MKVVRLSDLHASHLYPPRKYSCYSFLFRLSQPQGHSAARRIMSMKNSTDTIRNQTHDLSACSTAPQPCHCVPPATTGVRVNENQNLTVRASRVTSNTTKSQEIYQKSCTSRTQQRIRNLKQTLQHRHSATSGHCHVCADIHGPTDVAHYTTVPVNISMSEQHTQSNGCMTIRMCVIWTPVSDHDLQFTLQT